MKKLTSRKFWLSVAAMLGSIATSVAGLQSNNQTVAVVGIVCAVISAAIYAGCEAYVDAASVASEIITLVDDEEEESTEESEEKA